MKRLGKKDAAPNKKGKNGEFWEGIRGEIDKKKKDRNFYDP